MTTPDDHNQPARVVARTSTAEGRLLVRYGFEPYDTESAARIVARKAAEEIATLQKTVTNCVEEMNGLKAGNARLIAERDRLRYALLGAQAALRKAMPFLPADKEAHFCGEWLDEINEELNKS